VDVRNDTTGRDRDAAEQFVQLLIVADRQLNVAWHDTVLLVVARRVAGELQDFGRQVLHDGSQIHWRTGTDTSRIAALSQVSVNTTNWELQAYTVRAEQRKKERFFINIQEENSIETTTIERTNLVPIYQLSSFATFLFLFYQCYHWRPLLWHLLLLYHDQTLFYRIVFVKSAQLAAPKAKSHAAKRINRNSTEILFGAF
jgi:hypothetical protein